MKKIRISAFLTAFAMLLLPFGAFAQENESTPETVIEYSDYMKKNMIKTYAHLLADTYYYGIDDDELLYAVICKAIDDGKVEVNSAVQAMIEALGDNHAEFYTNEEFFQMTEDISGEFVGIGVTISKKDDGVIVISVTENAPAFKAGIKSGDYIIGINGTSTDGLDTSAVRNLIVGEEGTDVTVSIKRESEIMDVVCTRAYVEVSQLETRMLNDDTAYMRLIQFTTASADEVNRYLAQLKADGTKKLVLDLRSNPGGDLTAAVEIAKAFISAGKIGELKYKDESKNTIIYSDNYNAPRLNIAVLVNESSASAAEFLTAAFQGRKAAKIIGTTTYGKGSMQSVRQIATGAGIKYTVGEFFSIDGKRINTVGVTPDIEIENERIAVNEEDFEKIDFDEIDNENSNGKMTLALEQRLNALGLFASSPDEVFDEETKAAVEKLQGLLGYDVTGVAGVYEYMYLNDYTYDFDITVDNQLNTAIEYLSKF